VQPCRKETCNVRDELLARTLHGSVYAGVCVKDQMLRRAIVCIQWKGRAQRVVEFTSSEGAALASASVRQSPTSTNEAYFASDLPDIPPKL
jgi:hypothetical protein